jgi:hypothetical protein
MDSGAASHNVVEPTTSVNRNVTVPDGGRTPTAVERTQPARTKPLAPVRHADVKKTDAPVGRAARVPITTFVGWR